MKSLGFNTCSKKASSCLEMQARQPAHGGSSPQDQWAHFKYTDFRRGYCFQPAVKIKILHHDYMAIVLEAGLWLCHRKEWRRRQQGKLSRARDKSEHKNIESVCGGGGGGGDITANYDL